MFNKIEEILTDLKSGKKVIVVDDESRENECDIIMAAEFAKPQDINFITREARGLICVPMEEERAKQLDLSPMSNELRRQHQADRFGTAWMISVDAAKGITTG